MKKKSSLLLLLLVVTAVLIAAVGAYLKFVVLKPLGLYQEKNIIAVPFLLMTDEETQYTLRMAQQEAEPTSETVETEIPETETVPVETAPPTTEPVTEPATEPPVESTAAATEPEPVVIDASWFDDALFIGDSLTKSMSVYSPLGQAHYFCDVGMSVFDAQSVKCNVGDLPSMTLEQLLSQNTYGKIYIGLGINGIMSTHENILDNYQDLIDMIREKQPDAVIILQAIMTVGRGKAASKDYFSLENIYALNESIAALAEGENMRYINVNEWIADEEGYLPDDLTKDGYHLYAPVYSDWAQWLMDNAATLGIE